VDDLTEPHNLDRLRRSIAMLAPGQPDGLDRDRALQIIRELQGLQWADRRYRELVARLRAILDRADRARP
jgi:hypothetical protein